MDNDAIKRDIGKIVNEVASELGYLIYDYNILVKGVNSSIVVKIDHIEGISHGDCEDFSKNLVRKIDMSEVLPNYHLEVSSPGLNRRLRNLDDFVRFKSRKAKVIFNINGKQLVQKGTIEEVIDNEVVLTSESGTVRIRFDNIKSANLEY